MTVEFNDSEVDLLLKQTKLDEPTEINELEVEVTLYHSKNVEELFKSKLNKKELLKEDWQECIIALANSKRVKKLLENEKDI